MTLSRICDICRTGNETVARYGLARYVSRTDRRRADGRYYYRQVNAGGIDLCDPCWERHAKPKTRAARKTLPVHQSLAGSKLQVSQRTETRLNTQPHAEVRRL